MRSTCRINIAPAAIDNNNNINNNNNNIDNISSNNSKKHKLQLDDNVPFTPEEESLVLKRLKTHHSDANGTISLRSANRTMVKYQPRVTPRVGSASSSRETRRRRSRAHETFLHSLSTPSNIRDNKNEDEASQLTAIIRRKVELITSCALDAGIPVIHKLTEDEMLQLEKITLAPNSTTRMVRSLFNSLRLCIFPSENKMRQYTKGMIPDAETGIIKTRVGDEDVNVTFVRVSDCASFIQQHIQHLSNTKQLVRYHNMPPNVLFIETQADKGKHGDTEPRLYM